MAYDNIASTSSLTLASVKETFNTWRRNKKTRGEKIPEQLWDMVIKLVQNNTGTESKILTDLGITQSQLETQKQRRESIFPSTQNKSSDMEGLEFCEVTKTQEPAGYPLAYKPAEAFSTTTSVVELYRKDGALMKIHICTDQFDELLGAFFNGCQ